MLSLAPVQNEKYLQVIWPQYFCYVGLHSKGDDFVTHSIPNKANVNPQVFQDVMNTSWSDGDTIMLISMEKSLTPGKFLTILVPATNSATTQNLCACQLKSTRMYEIISTLWENTRDLGSKAKVSVGQPLSGWQRSVSACASNHYKFLCRCSSDPVSLQRYVMSFKREGDDRGLLHNLRVSTVFSMS